MDNIVIKIIKKKKRKRRLYIKEQVVMTARPIRRTTRKLSGGSQGDEVPTY